MQLKVLDKTKRFIEMLQLPETCPPPPKHTHPPTWKRTEEPYEVVLGIVGSHRRSADMKQWSQSAQLETDFHKHFLFLQQFA